MMGFSKEELIELMDRQEITKEEQEILLPVMKENYDGYKFSLLAEKRVYNSNMCLYLLSEYVWSKRLPEKLVDMNIASDYSKLGNMLDLCKGENRLNVIEKTVSGEGIMTDITQKFNPAIEFTEKDLVSMLFYLGYLTINGELLGKPELKIPNKAMKEIYSDYFLKALKNETNISVQEDEYNEILKEIAYEGKIDKIVEVVHKYLNNLSNRDFQRFDEKYVKLIFYCLAMSLSFFRVKSEMEVQRKYPDLLIVPKKDQEKYYGVMIEFKYLKKEERNQLEEKQKEARKQIEEYNKFEEIASIPKLSKYTVIAVVDEIHLEEIK